jgi:4-hydroxy-tetrahydrodipicolinate synthase
MVRYTLQNAGGKPVVAGIEERSTMDAVARARLAAELGCTAVIATKPFGVTVTQDEIRKHYRRLAAESEVDVVAYNEAWLSGNIATPATMCDLASIPRLVAIKESTGVASTSRWMLEHSSELPALFQGAEALLRISVGFDGYIVAAANLLPELCNRLYSAPRPDTFRKFAALCRVYGLLSDNWIARIKAELHLRGILSTPDLAASRSEMLRQGA